MAPKATTAEPGEPRMTRKQAAKVAKEKEAARETGDDQTSAPEETPAAELATKSGGKRKPTVKKTGESSEEGEPPVKRVKPTSTTAEPKKAGPKKTVATKTLVKKTTTKKPVDVSSGEGSAGPAPQPPFAYPPNQSGIDFSAVTLDPNFSFGRTRPAQWVPLLRQSIITEVGAYTQTLVQELGTGLRDQLRSIHDDLKERIDARPNGGAESTNGGGNGGGDGGDSDPPSDDERRGGDNGGGNDPRKSSEPDVSSDPKDPAQSPPIRVTPEAAAQLGRRLAQGNGGGGATQQAPNHDPATPGGPPVDETEIQVQTILDQFAGSSTTRASGDEDEPEPPINGQPDLTNQPNTTTGEQPTIPESPAVPLLSDVRVGDSDWSIWYDEPVPSAGPVAPAPNDATVAPEPIADPEEELPTGPLNGLDYPDLSTVDDGCASFAPLGRYWSFHRAIDPTPGVEPFRSIGGYRFMGDNYVHAAIYSVTQAISRHGGQQRFGIWSYQASYHYYDQKVKRTFINPDRVAITPVTNERVIIPFLISDEYNLGNKHSEKQHTLVLDCIKSATGCTVTTLDSASNHYNKGTNRSRWETIIGAMLRETGFSWGPFTFADKRVIRQPGDTMSCGLLSILNAWMRALNLEHNQAFNFSSGQADFLNEGVKLVNLALAGYLDSAAIYHWLLCKRYVLPRPANEIPTFLRTWAVPNHDTFEVWRTQNRAAGPAIPAAPVVVRPDSGHIGERLPANEALAFLRAAAVTELERDIPNALPHIWQVDRNLFLDLYPEVVRRWHLNNARNAS